MLNREFEKEVQHKLKELRFTPPDAAWDIIEASLPQKNRRRLVFFGLLLCLLAGGGIWYFINSSQIKNDDQGVVRVAVKAQAGTTAKQALPKDAKEKLAGVKPALITTNDAAGNVTAKANTSPQKINSAGVSANGLKKKFKQQTSHAKNGYAETLSEDKLFLSGGMLYSTKKTNDKDASEDDKTMKAITAEGPGKATFPVTGIENLSHAKSGELNDKPGIGNEKIQGHDDMMSLKAGSTLTAAGNAAKPGITKKKQLTWELGLHASGGLSNVKNGLFEKTMYAADPQNNSGGPLGGGVAFGSGANPTAGFAYSAGLYAEKLIAKRWSFYTGMQYHYASNNIQVGSKVDSAISLNFSSNILESSVYYRGGVSTTYTSHYHLLQLPLLVKYKPSAGWPLYLEAGGSVSYLAGTNGLQYNATRNAYISSEDAFNRWLLSGHAGIGVKLAQKTKLPLNLGYRFGYTATSLTKEAFGQQHLSTSLLYLDIRLNK